MWREEFEEMRLEWTTCGEPFRGYGFDLVLVDINEVGLLSLNLHFFLIYWGSYIWLGASKCIVAVQMTCTCARLLLTPPRYGSPSQMCCLSSHYTKFGVHYCSYCKYMSKSSIFQSFFMLRLLALKLLHQLSLNLSLSSSSKINRIRHNEDVGTVQWSVVHNWF